jgi:hypothetical protein
VQISLGGVRKHSRDVQSILFFGGGGTNYPLKH